MSSISRQSPPSGGENRPESSRPNVLPPPSGLEPPNYDLIMMTVAGPSTRPTVPPPGQSAPSGPPAAPGNGMPLPPPPSRNLNCEKTKFYLKNPSPPLNIPDSDRTKVFVPTSLALSEDEKIIASIKADKIIARIKSDCQTQNQIMTNQGKIFIDTCNIFYLIHLISGTGNISLVHCMLKTVGSN